MYVTDLNEFIKGFSLMKNYPKTSISTRGGELQSTYSRKCVGTVAIMCPVCYHVTKHRVKIEIDTSVKTMEEIDLHIFTDTVYRISKCPCCLQENLYAIEIDPNISNAISILNKKGYYTKYCCEGHSRKESSYIYFKDKDIMLNYIDTLPLSWYIDYSKLKYDNRFVIRADGWNRYEALYEISEWAMSLKSRHLTYVGDDK